MFLPFGGSPPASVGGAGLQSSEKIWRSTGFFSPGLLVPYRTPRTVPIQFIRPVETPVAIAHNFTPAQSASSITTMKSARKLRRPIRACKTTQPPARKK